MVTAAALAESARQLAQSAAEFGKEEEVRPLKAAVECTDDDR